MKDGSITIKNSKLYTKPRSIVPQYQEGYISFPDKNMNNLRLYKSIRLKEIQKGIDLIINAPSNGEFEFYIEIKPNIKVEKISLKIENLNELSFKEFKAFSATNEIPIKVIKNKNNLAFEIGNYDIRKGIIIDPVAMLISPHNDIVFDVQAESNDVIAVGCTDGLSAFGSTPRDSFGGVGAGFYDVFITKLSSNLSNHLQTTIIGSSNAKNECAYGVKLDNNGNVYVVGGTEDGSNFGISPNIFGNPGQKDVFLIKLNNSLNTILYNDIFASPNNDVGYAIDISNGRVFITGYTANSPQFTNITPNVFGIQGLKDVFVISVDTFALFNPFLAIISSSDDDIGKTIKVDRNGNVFIGGMTKNSVNFAPNRINFGTSGNLDGFITKLSFGLNNHFNTAIFSSPLDDYINTIAIDTTNGNIFFGGLTKNSSNFICSNCQLVYGTSGGVSDAFISRIDNNFTPGSEKVAILTSQGQNLASDSEAVNRIIIHFTGQIWAVGYTHHSQTFTPNQIIRGTTNGFGQFDAFLVRLNNNLNAFYQTYICTSSDDYYATSIDVTNGSVAYIGGWTIYGNNFYCSNCPSKYVYGSFMNANDGFVVFEDVQVSNNEKLENNFKFENGFLYLNMKIPNYVGYEIYDFNGRLKTFKSIGYLSAGSYKFEINAKGQSIIKIRIGDEVYIKKEVLR
ncbi:MAG: hypothetical protein ABIL76_00465 [candidate division WOR-3 bacterium]